MTTIIEELIDDERGVVVIETTFICIFFSFILSFAIYQSIMITLHLNAFKLASQISAVISQRNIFYDGNDLSSGDMDSLDKIIERFYPDVKKGNISLIIESLAYSTRQYKKIQLDSNTPVCSIAKPLNSYGINVLTSYGKFNGIYRVTVCLRTFSGFLNSNPGFISESAIEPGHYH